MRETKIIVVTKKELIKFIDFPDTLYINDDKYVPYMRADLKKTLKQLLFDEKSYTALLAVDENGKAHGRVLFTIDKNKQLKTDKCGFFALYDCEDNLETSRMLLGEMVRRLKEMGAEYVSGTYFPYDPDNRRGIMIKGFERAPLIFTSYNPPYYDAQICDAGFEKHADTYEFTAAFSEKTFARFERVVDFSNRHFRFHVDTLDLKNIERDIDDVCAVMQAATNEIVYQEAPSRETIENIFREWKSFIEPSLILIARKDDDNTPIGIAVSLPDYFQVFRKMRGRLDLRGILAMLTERKKIHSFRGILQYVIPEYQKFGVLPAMYLKMNESAKKLNMDYAEAGTIMENNRASIAPLEAAGAELSRIYRIYYKKISGDENADN